MVVNVYGGGGGGGSVSGFVWGCECLCVMFSRCKLSVGLLSGRYSKPPNNEQQQFDTEDKREDSKPLSKVVCVCVCV